jgi:kumamolisin
VAASSGDNGAVSDLYGGTPVKEVSLPASDPLTLAVGGTTHTANPVTGTYISETTWNGGTGSFSVTPGASGGGFSHLYPRPAYQDGVPGIPGRRAVPDVADDANQQGAPRSSWPPVASRRSTRLPAPAPPRRCGRD